MTIDDKKDIQEALDFFQKQLRNEVVDDIPIKAQMDVPDFTCLNCRQKQKEDRYEAFMEGYKQAIDDFKNLCLKHKSKDEYPIMCFDEFTINRFAEQLKEQKNG